MDFAYDVGVYVYIVVIDVFGDIGKQLAADLVGLTVENDQIDRHIVVQQKFPNGVHRHPKRLIFGIAVDAGGNQRKGYRLTAIFFRQIQRCPITGFQKLLLPMPAIPPARTDCMDHIFAG